MPPCRGTCDRGAVAAVDTNVLVRLLVADDHGQHREALKRLTALREKGEQVFVSSVVLAELSWVLDAAYGLGRARIAEALGLVLETEPFEVEDRHAVKKALEDYAAGPSSFSDYLVVALAADRNQLPVLTFDKKLQRHEGCERP